ncbi:MAG: type II toxin-antitoxin system prevent-host-death family antitoxin [Actinobacteria bacterium]|nr:type II toxin-antitoxin system prevent-host-death family antitoxin [Actinomycetota bacterium]
MIEVGVRELKNSLSSYLRRVRQGETVVVTDRGVPVARMIPAGVPEHLANLMADGRVTWSGESFVPPRKLPPLAPGPPLSDYIAEDRR